MKLRKHISFFFILAALTALFAHTVIPHHHHTAHFGICVELAEECTHDHAPETNLNAEQDEDQECETTGCAPTLPFRLNHQADFGSELLPLTTWLTLYSLFITEPESQPVSLYSGTPVLISQYVLKNLPRRAPPMA